MTGEYRNTVDDKGRLMIPPKIREQLGTVTELVLTKSPFDTLWLFTKTEFEKLSAAVSYGPLSMFNENARILDMTVIAPAREVELDKTGRLGIPQVLREYAGIEAKGECVIQGSRNHVEIISSEAYEAMMKSFKAKAPEAGNQLSMQRMGM